MTQPSGFRAHFAFALAGQYFNASDHSAFSYTKKLGEKVGTILRAPLGVPLQFGVRNFRNPLAIAGVTFVVAALVAIAFYSVPALLIIGTVVKPWMIKLAIFALVQAALLGAGIRAFSRFSNQELYGAWQRGEIIPTYAAMKI